MFGNAVTAIPAPDDLVDAGILADFRIIHLLAILLDFETTSASREIGRGHGSSRQVFFGSRWRGICLTLKLPAGKSM